MINNIALVDDIDVIRNTLEAKGLALTLRVVAQAIRLNASVMQQGELSDKRLDKEDILAEYNRIADRLDNQAAGLQANIKKLMDRNEPTGELDATTEA